MKNLKILKTFIFATMILFVATTSVYANETNRTIAYYTNNLGVQLTQDEYNILKHRYEELDIATFTQEQVDIILNDPYLSDISRPRSETHEIYVRSDVIFDHLGNLISTNEREVTESEAMDFVNNPPVTPFANVGGPTHQTSMKKLTIGIEYGMSQSTAIVTNTFLTMPATRSNDVLAMRFNTSSLSVATNGISGNYNHNGTIVETFSNTYANLTMNLSNASGAGVGVSFPLRTGGTSMSQRLSVFFGNFSTTEQIVWGTFQHAASAVSLSESKNYVFVPGQLGNVLAFRMAATGNAYDNMAGVACRAIKSVPGTCYTV